MLVGYLFSSTLIYNCIFVKNRINIEVQIFLNWKHLGLSSISTKEKANGREGWKERGRKYLQPLTSPAKTTRENRTIGHAHMDKLIDNICTFEIKK